jgi:glutamate synthase (NADPH/NADH) small chain|tara:strand:- start:1633 stop:3069 length:1437 start_codon:yes stop_codon:yes gene_type:complete
MGKVTGFLELDRQDRKYRPAADRVRNFKEFFIELPEQTLQAQASRCMDCGIPFCHDVKGLKGCPVNNQIPDWNDLVYKGEWENAIADLHSTNNFPEFTGRICPAPCEASCTLNIIDNPVTIKSIECAIVDKAWKNGWIKPQIAEQKTGKKVAVIGSGPAGLAASQQLARAGHEVHLYEKNSKLGGLLRYGIPDFKLDKSHIDRRINQLSEEGIIFHTNVNVGIDISSDEIISSHDAIILAGGAEMPRDLPIQGRNFKGIHYAMDFLPQQNRRVSNESYVNPEEILATSKNVVVIGGGDTGSDCIGTSIRQGAISVTQLEIMPEPPEKEDKLSTWPNWPLKLRTSSSQEEGANREFSVMTQSFEGDANGNVKKLHCIKVDKDFKPIESSEFHIKADLVLLAMGFVSPKFDGLLKDSKVNLDNRKNVLANTTDYKTNLDKVWTAGDMRRGQSLVVWAIREGRQCARAVDEFLMGNSLLPR